MMVVHHLHHLSLISIVWKKGIRLDIVELDYIICLKAL